MKLTEKEFQDKVNKSINKIQAYLFSHQNLSQEELEHHFAIINELNYQFQRTKNTIKQLENHIIHYRQGYEYV